MNHLAITMLSQKKLNTYSVESPCECLPRVARYARQPWAIKRTTRTELHHEDIYIVKYIHWNIGINPTALQVENNHHERFIHCKFTAIFMALRGEDIYNFRYIYWKWGMNPTALQVGNNHLERFIL